MMSKYFSENRQDTRIAIIGLGYVGLPLAVEFAKKYEVIGLDIHAERVAALQKGLDSTLEVTEKELLEVLGSGQLKLTHQSADMAQANIFIITVPTPTDKHHKPDLRPLLAASKAVGEVLKVGDIVIYESTVYPGCTEDDCVPVLEQYSGLKFNKDFYAGYSPERINPGDKEHTLTKIQKVTAGSTPEIAKIINELYGSIIEAGTFMASSIKVAEAAKVIENSQRDINIAFVNELSKIFNLLGIDTMEVLEAAGTKWNFLKFSPGLVGGHCIGVDPYYLAQKAQELGYHPEIILAGRRVNDSMGKHVATELIKHMMRKDLKVLEAKVLILGFAFKENCPDYRNTRVIDIYHELKSFDMDVDIFDPWVNTEEVKKEYGVELLNSKQVPDIRQYSAIVLAVAHKDFEEIPLKKSSEQVIYDVKSTLSKEDVDARL